MRVEMSSFTSSAQAGPGLKVAGARKESQACGSLTLYIQKDSPGADKQSNRLPAPDGPIYMVMRLYWPKTEPSSILPPGEGAWKPPGIVATN
jgi:hypothetical protein